jgi:hypothetical protein
MSFLEMRGGFGRAVMKQMRISWLFFAAAKLVMQDFLMHSSL